MTSFDDLILEAHWLVLDSLITEELDEELGTALGNSLDEEGERTTAFYHKTHYKHPSQLPASHFDPTAHRPPQEKTAFARRRPSTEPTQHHHRGPVATPQHSVAKAVRSITKGHHQAWRTTFKRARKQEPLADTEKKHLGSLRKASLQAHKLSRQTKRTSHSSEKSLLHRSASTAHRRAAEAARNAEHHFRNKGHEQHAAAFRHLANFHANKAANHDIQMESKASARHFPGGAKAAMMDARMHSLNAGLASLRAHSNEWRTGSREARYAHYNAMKSHHKAEQSHRALAKHYKQHGEEHNAAFHTSMADRHVANAQGHRKWIKLHRSNW